MRNAFIDVMTHAKFHFNRLMLTLIFGIRASDPPRAWRTTKKAGLDRVKGGVQAKFRNFTVSQQQSYSLETTKREGEG